MSETISTPRRSEAGEARDPIHDLVARLNRDATQLATKDPELSRSVRQLTEAAGRPGRTDDPNFRTRTAYALQDMERLGGPISTVPAALREEMTRLAGSAPGLQNERLQELVRTTKSLDDMQLVRDIRRTAMEVAFQGGDQSGKLVMDRVEALENRARLGSGPSTGPAEQSQSPKTPPGPTSRSPAADEATPEPPGRKSDRQAHQNDSQPSPLQPSQQAGIERSVSGQGPGALALALGALARHAAKEVSDVRSQATSVVDRIARHGDAQQQQRDEATIQGAERSQRAALDALQAFQKGAGSNILTKIQDAAKSEPGGLQAVLSEMREGGRFSSLRSQFNADLVVERGMSAAYDKVASSLQQYSGDRTAVEAIGARRGTGQALEARFEKMDAEIGKATAAIPSRGDGKSVLEDLGDKMREILDRAVQAVKSAFKPGPRAASSPSPSP